MSKEGLGELLAEGRIIPASAVDLAQARLGVAVRAGAPKPDISTVEALRHLLLRAKSINALSTTGLYLTDKLLPNLGIAGEVTSKDQRRDCGDRCHRRGRDCNSPSE